MLWTCVPGLPLRKLLISSALQWHTMGSNLHQLLNIGKVPLAENTSPNTLVQEVQGHSHAF